MPVFELEDTPQYEAIPEMTELVAELIDCQVREATWEDRNDPTKKARQVSFRFRIIDDDVEDGKYFGRTMFGNTPDTFTSHPDCKLRIWVQELLGKDLLPVGFKFDTESLVGATAKITVANRTRVGADGTPIVKDYVDTIRRAAEGDTAKDLF